jgi:hypothetical protein
MREAAVAAREAEAGISAPLPLPNGHAAGSPGQPLDLTGQPPAAAAAERGVEPPSATREPMQVDLCDDEAGPQDQQQEGANGHAAEPQPPEVLHEFRAGEASECPICCRGLSADTSTGQVPDFARTASCL